MSKNRESWLFDGTVEMTDGIDEACALTKSISTSQLPTTIISSMPEDFLPSDFENIVTDSILAGELFDPALDMLPKKIDPIIFWTTQPKIYGTPIITKK